ncbi:MAG: hypothetical protein AB1500_02960 [Bacillota bacterium]
MAYIGFESFTDERLRDLKKGITVEQQEEAAKIFKDFASYIRRLKPASIGITILTPLPGTE